jgi:hypothetical protein
MRERNRRLGAPGRPAWLTRGFLGPLLRSRPLLDGGWPGSRRGGWHRWRGGTAAVRAALAVTAGAWCRRRRRDWCARHGRPCGRCRSGRRGRRGLCLAGPRLLRLLGRECFFEPADHWRLDRGGRRPHELAHLLELGHDGLALYAELLCEFINPDLRHCAPSTRSSSRWTHQPVGAARAPSGVRLCCSSPHAHRSLIAISACFPGPRRHGPFWVPPYLPSPSVWPRPGAAGRDWPRYSAS